MLNEALKLRRRARDYNLRCDTAVYGCLWTATGSELRPRLSVSSHLVLARLVFRRNTAHFRWVCGFDVMRSSAGRSSLATCTVSTHTTLEDQQSHVAIMSLRTDRSVELPTYATRRYRRTTLSELYRMALVASKRRVSKFWSLRRSKSGI